MTKHSEIPEFGTLSGVRVVFSGISIAGPFGPTLMAENGADVIWIENPKMPDPAHSPYGLDGVQNRRNMRSLTLNMAMPEGGEVFKRLMRQTDIFIEASRGGTFAEWGLDDETLWKENPALVIVHISGFGQTGVPDYVNRSSWDGIGQAFSGFMGINGYPEPEPPYRTGPYTCDYITALNASWAALAGLLKARQTGVGESIDIAQYEVMARVQADYPMRYFNWNRPTTRNGNRDPMLCGYYPYKCGDGKYLFTAWVGATALRGGLKLLGFEWGSEDFPADKIWIQQGSEGAKKFEEKFIQWCAERTVEQAEKELIEAGVPCSPIMSYEDMLHHPHYKARDVIIEWDDPERGHVKGLGFLPKFTKHPQRLWRGMPPTGADNLDVLSELGYKPEEIEKLAESKAIVMPTPKPA
ncbi:MAG: CoA transferase [Anaerolineales bacterium]|jgi:L-carnitine CoA-transferase|nr:CoA transferase [Anaerolineales bacterium]